METTAGTKLLFISVCFRDNFESLLFERLSTVLFYYTSSLLF